MHTLEKDSPESRYFENHNPVCWTIELNNSLGCVIFCMKMEDLHLYRTYPGRSYAPFHTFLYLDPRRIKLTQSPDPNFIFFIDISLN
jgi:hypothetical protein